MTPNEYQKLAERTADVDFRAIRDRLARTDIIRLVHAQIGICTEAGEVADIIKKSVYYGKPVDVPHLVEELGDLLWYVAEACNAIHVPMERIMQQNIEKLRVRYPDKFTEELAAARLDKK